MDSVESSVPRHDGDSATHRTLASASVHLGAERLEASHDRARRLASEYARIIDDYECATLAQADVLLAACRKAAELRDAVRDYSSVLRELDTPPEQSLALVKSAVKDLRRVRRYDVRMVLDDIGRWFVDAYYAPSPASQRRS